MLQLFATLIISVALSEILYVSKKGIDLPFCGQTLDAACGTMFAATTKDYYNSSIEIHVHNGQNKHEINKYFMTNKSVIYHPCLPFPNILINSITFNHQYIHKMDNWFQQGVCYRNGRSNITYKNKYLFTYVNNLNNLYIDDYNSDDIPFSILRVDHGLQLNPHSVFSNCIFQNITYSLKIPMFDLFSDFIRFAMTNSTFTNIHSTTHFMYAFITTIIKSKWTSLTLHNVSIFNSTFNSTIIRIDTAWFDLTASINISACHFAHITTDSYIMLFKPDVPFIIDISNTMFEYILNGAIIQSTNSKIQCDNSARAPWGESLIHISNIFVSTSQTSAISEISALFNFGASNDVVIRNMHVVYYYDLAVQCHHSPYNDNCLCNNPMPLIYNKGYAFIDNTLFNILYINNYQLNGASFEFNNTSVYFIHNIGNMYLYNSVIDTSLGSVILWSQGYLQLLNTTIDSMTLNTDTLKADNIIYQEGYELYMDNCILGDAHFNVLHLYHVETVRIDDTIFKQSTAVFYVFYVGEFILQGCKFYRIGCFYCDIQRYMYWLEVTQTVNVSLLDNEFYHNCGCEIALFHRGNHLLLQNNKFVVDYSGYQQPVAGIIEVTVYSESSTVINNEFMNDNIQQMPWLFYWNNNGIHCISGNKMDNYALRLLSTNLTSCLRPEIINCFHNPNLCERTYGKINKQIPIDLYTKSVFRITSNGNYTPYIWYVERYSYMALDNVEFRHNSPRIGIGNIFLLESYLVFDNLSDDILYDNASCNVFYNDRMAVNIIAKLLIRCKFKYFPDYDNTTYDRTMNAESTTLVNHFSPTILHFSASSDSYWPGSLLYFNYSITDIFGNIVNYSTNDRISIIIQNSNLSLVRGFFIDEYGTCPTCDAAITIFGANLLDSYNKSFKLTVDLEYDYFFLECKYLYLQIIGCPIGYGATSNKYQCEKCPFGKYNLIPNNPNECLLCDTDSQTVSQCVDYIRSLHNEYLYLWLLLLLPFILCCVIASYWKIQYDKASVVRRSLVLIIGISQFDDKTLLLDGVRQNIDDLVELWNDKYNYDVYVCNEPTLYCTKQQVINFIDMYVNKIKYGIYDAVIIHVISHGSNDDVFITSDRKNLKLDFICHELISSEKDNNCSSLIKLIFYHGCRGGANYSNESPSSKVIHRGYNFHSKIIDTKYVNNCPDCNLVIISGNIPGRTMSDTGGFTKCICESFGKNVERIMKADFHGLIAEIGNNLQKKTKNAEICHMNGNLIFDPIRFEKYMHKDTDKIINEFYFTQKQTCNSWGSLNKRLLDESNYPL
eukprot:425836_1